MALNWRPHTTPPVFDGPTLILVAWPDEYGTGAYLDGLYNVAPYGRVESVFDGTPPDEPYYWITEDELLETLPCVA